MTTSKKKGAATAARKKPGPAARKKARAELARAGQFGAAIAAAAGDNWGGVASGRVKLSERTRLVEAVAYLPPAGEAKPEGPAPSLTQEQVDFVNCQAFTRGLVEKLANRLQPVLRAAPLAGDEEKGPEAMRNRSALAEWLAYTTGSQADINRLLISVHDRLDLE